jgi:7,8-dihydro-6-hydroxymethylpterin dimethyltransferase
MAFQDAWNIDLQRLQRCCVHVAMPGKKLVPFCAYYLTDSTGRRLAPKSGSGLQPGDVT